MAILLNHDDFKIACPHESCGHRPFTIRHVEQDYSQDSFIVSLECGDHYRAISRVAWDVVTIARQAGQPIPFECCEPLPVSELAEWLHRIDEAIAEHPARFERMKHRRNVVNDVLRWRRP